MDIINQIKDNYKYNSVVVAKYIVARANQEKIAINMTKIQKLLYIAYGSYLAISNQRLTNEHPQAWPFGPVFPTTRNKLLKADLYSINLEDESLKEIKEDADMKDLVTSVFRFFGKYTAAWLTAWSHSEGTPWEKTTTEDNFKWGDTIPDSYIFSYFSNIIVRNG